VNSGGPGSRLRSTGSGGQGGLWYGLGAYTLWGLFPVYFKLISFVPADQIIAHRIVWSFLLLAAVLALGSRRRERLLTRNVIRVYTTAALLIAVNWFIYVWAVTHNFILETSLGYFITPLVNVLLGVVILGERLRRFQWVAIAFAAAGVGYLAVAYGNVPWIAIGLALSFGTYGLVKKRAPLGSVVGLTLETGLLLVPALAFLAATEFRGNGAFLHLDPGRMVLVAAAGPVTTLPLVLFAAAVQRIPLSAIGILQFIAPTVQFVLGVVVYEEPFSGRTLVGFALVWVAVSVFATEGIAASRRRSVASPAPSL
jgi:chloramphenicol-sensitive protein RarD